MRQPADHFEEEELHLVYIAGRLREATDLEQVLTEHSLDYLVETDTYSGGVVFRSARVGAFFYVREADLERTRAAIEKRGYKPYKV